MAPTPNENEISFVELSRNSEKEVYFTTKKDHNIVKLMGGVLCLMRKGNLQWSLPPRATEDIVHLENVTPRAFKSYLNWYCGHQTQPLSGDFLETSNGSGLLNALAESFTLCIELQDESFTRVLEKFAKKLLGARLHDITGPEVSAIYSHTPSLPVLRALVVDLFFNSAQPRCDWLEANKDLLPNAFIYDIAHKAGSSRDERESLDVLASMTSDASCLQTDDFNVSPGRFEFFEWVP